MEKSGLKLNWENGLKRIGSVTGLTFALTSFVYATQEGLEYSWSYLSTGWWIQKKIAFVLVKLHLGVLPDIIFVFTHSVLIFFLIYMIFGVLSRSVLWIGSGFKKMK